MSALFKTQVASMLITTVVTLIPAFIYSGFFISVHSMGPEARFMGLLMPATFFMEICRGIFLKGLGPAAYVLQLLAIIGYGAIYLTLAIFKVKKRLD
jgi:ABC-type multidrug transport system permease subunit